jgi:hypothetical protein|tara:strand:+ start:40 stop:600 length:561 start_codon:yes stop_codon:yes gene_type:complete
MGDETIVSKRKKVTSTEQERKDRNKAIIPAMKKLKKEITKNKNKYNKEVKIAEKKRYKKLLDKLANKKITTKQASNQMMGDRYAKGLFGKKTFNEDVLNVKKNKPPKALIMKEVKPNLKKGNKNITKSQQKTIDQAAPVIDRIVEGDKRKVRLAPKPEELKVNKKYGGKITYRMSGGKVAGAGYDD